MKNNLHFQGTVVAFLLALLLAGVGMVSCQKDYDPMDQISGMADKNIPGTYSWISVDTTTMQTEICELVLSKDGTGTYRMVVAGDKMAATPESYVIAWTRGEYVDNNVWVEIHVTFDASSGKEPMTVKWGSAALKVGDKIFNKAAYINNVDGIYEKFANTKWTKADTTFFTRTDTVADTYLAWEQAKGNDAKLTETELAEWQAYFAQQWVKDTIAWYNENHLPAGSKPVPDSVKVGKKSGDKYLCVFYKPNEVTDLIPVEIRLGEEKVDCNLFHFDRDEATHANTGAFTYHYMEQDEARLRDVTIGNLYDSIADFKIDHWCICTPTSTGAFELIAVGTKTVSVKEVKDGSEVRSTEVGMDWVESFKVVGLYPGEEVTINGMKHLPLN